MKNQIINKNYGDGIIEVEGSEEFVSKELDKFWEGLNTQVKSAKQIKWIQNNKALKPQNII